MRETEISFYGLNNQNGQLQLLDGIFHKGKWGLAIGKKNLPQKWKCKA